MNQDNPRRTNYSCSHAVKGILLIHCIASILGNTISKPVFSPQ